MHLNEPPNEPEYTLKDFRKHLSFIVGEVAHGQARVKVTSYGKTAGYFVSEQEIAYMEALEEELDRQAVERIRAEGKNRKRIPWEQVKLDNGL
jgi:PHD/YefM family antitoxin component YafN of YafNO toxin-antitoxin module